VSSTGIMAGRRSLNEGEILLYKNTGALRRILTFGWYDSKGEVVTSIMRILSSNKMRMIEYSR